MSVPDPLATMRRFLAAADVLATRWTAPAAVSYAAARADFVALIEGEVTVVSPDKASEAGANNLRDAGAAIRMSWGRLVASKSATLGRLDYAKDAEEIIAGIQRLAFAAPADLLLAAKEAAVVIALAALNSIARTGRDEEARETADRALAEIEKMMQGDPQ